MLEAAALAAANLNINQERRGYVFYSEGGGIVLGGAGAVWWFRQYTDTKGV